LATSADGLIGDRLRQVFLAGDPLGLAQQAPAALQALDLDLARLGRLFALRLGVVGQGRRDRHQHRQEQQTHGQLLMNAPGPARRTPRRAGPGDRAHSTSHGDHRLRRLAIRSTRTGSGLGAASGER
jgi:hypothetical protein